LAFRRQPDVSERDRNSGPGLEFTILYLSSLIEEKKGFKEALKIESGAIG
jgi:hypothetical protein